MKTDHCSLPPRGWHCTGEPGHLGPCAAVPRARVWWIKILIILGGGGPALLILADRIAHAFGICLGF